MKKRILSVLLSVCMLMSLAVVFAVPVQAYSTTADPRGLILYVGYNSAKGSTKFPSYSSADITKLSSATKEYILCSENVVYNTYKFSSSSTKTIVTQANITNMSSTLINNPVDLQTIKNDYSSKLSNIGTHSLDTLASDVISQVNTIVSAVPNATIWLPFPHIPFPSLAANYNLAFTDYANYLQAQLGTKWTNNVRGFYWGTESVEQYYTPFNYNAAGTNFGNPLVQLMAAMDTKLVQKSKQFMWIPYLSSQTETMNRNGYVINKTTIFDYVFVQPGYYFDGTKFSNLGTVRASVLQNQMYNSGGSVIGGSKVNGAAKVGYEMEINSSVTQQVYNDRYWEYTNQFSTLKSSYPCVFYAGDRGSICGSSYGSTQCYGFVKTWLS